MTFKTNFNGALYVNITKLTLKHNAHVYICIKLQFSQDDVMKVCIRASNYIQNER